MPLTPFHMGPGCVVKAVAGTRFSLTVFGFAQVAMDVEPLVRVLCGSTLKHGYSHTYLGATLIGLFALFVGRPCCQCLLRRWTVAPGASFAQSLRGPLPISWPAATSGAFVGTYSHVFLDSLMHFDMEPLFPFAEGNTLQGWVAFGTMHWVCATAGVVGSIGILLRAWWQRSVA